jgi:antitoxin (DNA-binding transcriptional repressor) of toxin-antitoxin stability system
MNATIVDLRYNMKHVLRAIDRGETVTVLYRGKARARLTPITRPRAAPRLKLRIIRRKPKRSSIPTF